MRLFTSLLFCFFYLTQLFAQNENLEKSLNQLNTIKKELLDSIKKVDAEIIKIKDEIEYNKYLNSKSTLTSKLATSATYMMSEAFLGQRININVDSVELIGFERSKVKVFANGKTGFIRPEEIRPKKAVEQFITDYQRRKKLEVSEKRRIYDATKNGLGKKGELLINLAPEKSIEFKNFKRERFDLILVDKIIPPDSMKIKDLATGQTKLITQRRYRYLFGFSPSVDSLILAQNKVFEDSTREVKSQLLQDELNARYESKIKRLTKKYDAKTATKLANSEIWIGMTSEMIIDSIGRPNDINRTVTSYGVREQWVYKDIYLYLEDGVLTSYQD
ncbi:hypothetical protein [Ekhidna sp.]|uniref:hypothetical protein n=1 Tax=Ekhidna sp. TaxID=2608089 RepID=UPI003C7AC389